MVIDTFHYNASGTRWVNYLVLSLLVNAAVISFVSIEPKTLAISESSLLKVKFVSLKAAKPAPAKKYIEKQTTPSIVDKKVITETKAENIIKKQKVATTPKKNNKPVITKKDKPLIVNKEEKIINEKIIQKKEIVKKIEKQNYIAPVIANASNDKTTETVITKIVEATYRKQTPPVYPRRALELGQQGNVILHALIKPDGIPSELKVEDSSGYSLLDKAALAAVRKWEFEPTIKDGITIASWVRVPIEFIIQ